METIRLDSSHFIIDDISEFLFDPAIYNLIKILLIHNNDNSHLPEEIIDYLKNKTKINMDIFNKTAGIIITREKNNFSVRFQGFCITPSNDKWAHAIQKYCIGNREERLSFVGFDDELRYTTAIAYDITSESIIKLDASCQDNGDIDRNIYPPDFQIQMPEFDDMWVGTIISPFHVKNLEDFLQDPKSQNMLNVFTKAQSGGFLDDNENIDRSEVDKSRFFIARALDDGRGCVAFKGFCNLPTTDEWKSSIQQHIVKGERTRISTAGFCDKYNYGGAYDIDSLTIHPIDVTYIYETGNEFFNFLPEVKDPRNHSREFFYL